jgi:ribose 5-phosphate isomerase A
LPDRSLSDHASYWPHEIKNIAEKEAVASALANFASDGDIIGVGSGSSCFLGVRALGRRAKKDSLRLVCIPTSHEMEIACYAAGLAVTTIRSGRPTWVFDGADEIDPQRNLVKGRGGALLKEKLLMRSANRIFILADQSKFVDRLGSTVPIPVEIHPDGLFLVESLLRSVGATSVVLRGAACKDGPVITESGNLILDVHFDTVGPALADEIKTMPGVMETGLFMNFNPEIITGTGRDISVIGRNPR